MADLITAAYAKRRINKTTFTSGEDTLINELLAACSKQIRKFCRREFDNQQFDQLYNGTGHRRLMLHECPIISIARVASGPTDVLKVTNTASANQRATVAVTSTGLTLVRVASAVTTTNTLAFADSDKNTIGELATAITALGNGWSGTAVSGYSDWPSADLKAIQGAFNAKDATVGLKIHVTELSSYEIEADAGFLIRSAPGQNPFIPPYDDLIWTPGYHNYRVIYNAGFATVPEIIQEACAEWVAALFWQSKRDPGATKTSTSYPSQPTTLPTLGMPEQIRQMIEPYINPRLQL